MTAFNLQHKKSVNTRGGGEVALGHYDNLRGPEYLTLLTRQVSSVSKEILSYRVKCLQFKVGHGRRKYSLHHILFGKHAVSFSEVAG